MPETTRSTSGKVATCTEPASHYTSVLWPDFSEEDLLTAIIDFQKRERRFGMTQEQIVKA